MGGGAFLFLVLALLGGGAALLMLDSDGAVAGMESGQFAELLQLGAWGLVLGSALMFMIRGRFSQALRSAAIWAAAFLVLIGLYAFGGEFRGIGERVLAALLPGRVAVTQGPDGRDQVMVMRGADDHFRLEAEVKGETVSFLVDTGASIVALDRADAERIGIDTGGLRYDARIMTANGVARAASITLPSLRVGEIERRNVRAAIPETGLGVSLLGMSFLGQLSSFEFRGEQLILTD